MFVEGQVYERKEIHEKHGGQKFGIISTPQNQPFILVFFDESQKENKIDENGNIILIGEGKNGDMKFLRGNKSLRDHEKEGKSVHLFKAVDKGINYEYLGIAKCTGYEEGLGPDKNGNERKIILFNLKIINDDINKDLVSTFNEKECKAKEIIEEVENEKIESTNNIDISKDMIEESSEKEIENKVNVEEPKGFIDKIKDILKGLFNKQNS